MTGPYRAPRIEGLRLLATIVVLAFALAGSAGSSIGIQGSYTTTITGIKPAVNGAWRITFRDGVTTITHLGKKAVSGRYVLAGDKITLSRESGPWSCGPTPGVYRWKSSASGKLLTLAVVSDLCIGRKQVLTQHPLRKVGQLIG